MRTLFYFFRRLYYRNVYLKSKHWKEFRVLAIASSGHRCNYPGCQVIHPDHPNIRKVMRDKPHPIQNLDVHHLNYRHLGRETVNDVMVVCRRHHKLLEGNKRYK